MSDPRHHDRPRVTLEQLLALKRSERPEPAFWEEFDRELHRRQLASVVARPVWYVRVARHMIMGWKRTAPVAAAGAAAVAGFLVLQHPGEKKVTAPQTVATAAAAPAVTPPGDDIVVPVAPVITAQAPETPRPSFERPVTSETRFVVHEYVAAKAPARTFVSVNSPNTFSSPDYDASVQMVNTLTSGYGYNARTGTAREAGSF